MVHGLVAPKKKRRRGKSRKKSVRAKVPLRPSPAALVVLAPALLLPHLPHLRRRPRADARPSSGFRFRFRIDPHRPLCPSSFEGTDVRF